MSSTLALTEQATWDALAEVKDPEIPVLSVVEMHIVNRVSVTGESVTVEITPTFSGCPAMDLIQAEIGDKLRSLGFSKVVVNKKMSGFWSTDLLNETSREKLRAFGIAPPPTASPASKPVACPHCLSSDTRLDSPFGSTLCKQIFFCNGCRQSFERFKRL